MRQLRNKNWFAALVSASVLTLIAAVAARLLLRHLSLFLSFDGQFSAIFAQIHDAMLTSPAVLLMAIAFPISLGMWKLSKQKLLCVILWALLWLFMLFLALLLTRVNGIRFADVLFSLLEIMQKGGFDGL